MVVVYNIILFGHVALNRCMIMLALHVLVCGSQCWQLCTSLHASLPLAGLGTNTLSPFVSP